MNINGADVYPGRPCPHSTGQGCDDYDNRPVDPCINFTCGWVTANSPLPDWMQPCNAKVILLFNKLTWQGLPVDLAIPVGNRIPPRALNWLREFAEKHQRPLLYTEQAGQGLQRSQTLLCYGPPPFRQQVAEWSRDGTRLW